MCNQCGNIYHQASYKIIEIPLPGATPASTFVATKEECPVVTQELAGPSNFFEREVKPQIPQPTVIFKSEIPVPRSTKTVFTHTEPWPTKIVFTQSSSTQAQMDKWKKEYVMSQERIL